MTGTKKNQISGKMVWTIAMFVVVVYDSTLVH